MRISKIEIEATADELKSCKPLSEICNDVLKNIIEPLSSYYVSNESEDEDDE